MSSAIARPSLDWFIPDLMDSIIGPSRCLTRLHRALSANPYRSFYCFSCPRISSSSRGKRLCSRRAYWAAALRRCLHED